ncbi:fibronectin type III domain-containing protein [Fulvivirga maritima]|uniref:fibronectin type III domain-containing protein n=1 Tax=Fulvivirga maritima TaxID=2904247 RepID=UPI001F3F11A4|nr:fibronectin type III domain-containing protein [Fulvivirga maritima]UII27632.1 fibronectin type III domain-containing protein [Fulvivirga maritima]
MKKYIYFLIFITGCFFSQQVSAQSYPVQATFQLTPPYSLYLSDYAAADNNRFVLNVLLRDLSRQDLQVRLRLTIEGTGVSITTRPDYRPQPLFLQGGMPLMLGAADLGAYFNPENLIFQGISKDQVVRGNALPEGFYRICFEVLEYNLGTEVSNMACGSAWLMLNDPPIINTPFNGEKVRVQDPQTQLFQWTPRHTGSPNSAFSTAYDFELVELWPEGRDPNNAIQSTPPIYETTTYSTSLVYGIAEPPLVPGRRYAFRVRARAINGIEPMDLFKNDGYSEVYSFIYGDACSPPVVVEASTVSSSRIKVSWQTGPAQTEFVVYYRKEGSDDEWQSEKTYLEELTLDGLQPETTYEFQVAALCGAANGGKSGVVTSATSENPVTNYTCGAQPGDIDLENQEALPELNPGDIFKAGDVEVRVINASGSNGTFSGKGHAEMPWLKHVKVRVEFEGIFINTDLQMITGAVTTIFNADSPLMFDLDALGGDDAAEEGGGAEDQEAPFDGTTIKVDGTVASVTVDESGQIIVEKEDGTTETFTQETDPETGERVPTQITDDEGNTYTVDKDGNVSRGGSGEGNTPDTTTESDSVLFVQKELIKEVLKHYKEEINLWLENNGKGPLDEALMRRLIALPDCLPENEEGLEAVLAKIEGYQENPEALLELVKEDDANKARIEELTVKLTGKQPPYAAGLSETEWDELLEMLCPYLVGEEERPELVTIDPITDDQFAAGIDNDKLEITYSIKPTEKYPLQYVKLEVYKNDGVLAYVRSEGLGIGEGKKFEWDGQVNQNIPDGEEIYIRSDESPFIIKIIASTSQDFEDSFQTETQGSVHPDVDAFLDNYEVAKYIEDVAPTSDMDKFEYYQQLATFMYDEVTSDQMDEQVLRNFTNALDYLGDQVRERSFLGRKVIVHDNYWVYLQDIESNLGSGYVNHPDYTMGGFSIRFQRNSTDQVSNHAYGMALDVSWQRNPYLSKGQLYFLQLLTGFKFFQNPSNPEDLKEAHDKLIGFGYQQTDISSIKEGFEHLNKSSLKTENFEMLLNETLGNFRSAASTFSQLVNRNTNLRNEVHFFNQKTPQEIAEIERQLFEELPTEADALLKTVKAIKSTEEINQLYDLYKEGYLKAFLLDKHKSIENETLLTVLNNLKGLFGFEAAIASLKEACEQPENGDYTYWVTNVTIAQPQSIPEATTYQAVGTFIESRKADYKEIFYSISSYSGIISVLNNSATSLAQNGFMLMSAEFAREFLDTGNGDIGWGGNWKRLKDFMHLELVADDKFSISN